MKLRILFITLMVTLILAACKPAAATPVASIPDESTAVPAQTDQPDAEPTIAFEASEPGTCVSETLDLPEVTADDWILGSSDAKVTILVYSDFQCPYCAMFDPLIDQLVKDNPEDFRLVFRNFPLSYHKNSILAATAAEAAGSQNKFFEMKTLIFKNQTTWESLSNDDFKSWLIEQATTLGLDTEKFTTDLEKPELREKIQNVFNGGYNGGVNGTPFVVVNNMHFQGVPDAKSILDFIEFSETKFKECPLTVIEKGKQYTVTLKTEKGDIMIELFPEQAPLTVNSFIFLAREGWYDGVTFHRVIPGFVAQSGDPSGTGGGTPGFSYSNEVTPELRFDQPGRVGMANGGPDTNGSQFFITYSAQPSLDGSYTVFGQVISGMDVLQKITPRDPGQSAEPAAGDKIIGIEISEK